ncbi:MAG: Asp/Glu/hydantoin racemase [Yaniella sp.]|uniref:maleate cis-trans isomerase family protein n=1 Tax=Yaniella sp. TaxID=2773929 RepID=UPI002649C735|nr:Asp/Glu/hydantoin racemase [Yaniella sp.]MDN5705135.1 Asp/Glu/hydantoin racemase [Yaniella sp.]MDN5731053.1 Asp/Glu/hydantoin racemase [Yaniella sp.]MDN5817700.1 Asp/Glu/hydantoin racemase [Yaniella sp.]MDN5838205.1 Asp/Glu/hydantoin racemase [Yaniella sp.]MDN5911654.1 Asp/Glu/hydantoin racemase [Yaniella sp.]
MKNVPSYIPDGPLLDRTLGIVNPYDMALDRELWRWMPDGVSISATRTPHHPLTVDELLADAIGNDDDLRSTASRLAAVEPDALVFVCASASFINGLDGARRISATLTEAAGAPAVTTSEALLEALDVLGIGQLAIATPYVQKLTSRLELFLADQGHPVVSTGSLNRDRLIWRVPYRVTADLIRGTDHPDAEAIFVSCTNLPTFDIIAPLEEELGKPILTANQVSAWAGLRRLGLSLPPVDQRLATATALPTPPVGTPEVQRP